MRQPVERNTLLPKALIIKGTVGILFVFVIKGRL
jgi:hypothetical protein